MREYEDALVFTKEESSTASGREGGVRTTPAGDPFSHMGGSYPVNTTERTPLDDYVSPVVARFYRGMR